MSLKNKIKAALALAVFVVPAVSFAQTVSTNSLQAQIQSLLAEVAQLQAQLTAAGGSSTTWCYAFNTNLSVGMSGTDVTNLQTALQKDGESVTVNGTFDDQTASAVTGFQQKYAAEILTPYGLTNGTGYAGKATRAELNSLYGCGNPTPTPISSIQTYSSATYGVTFSYPNNYVVKYGDGAFGTSDNQMGDYGIGMENSNLTSLITIEMPSNSYPDTGFSGAYLNVSVGKQITSSQCAAMNTAGSSPSNGTKTIGGIPFNWSVAGSAAAGTDYTNGSFSGYANGTCYVLLAGGVETNGAIGETGSDGVTITAVNQNSVLAALNSVLSTMTFSAPSTTSSTTLNPIHICPAWGCNGQEPIIRVPVASSSAPAITGIAPTSGATGSAVTITGTGFTSSNQVMFGGYVAAGSAVSANGTSLTFTVPAYESPTCTPGKPCSDLVMNVQPGVYQVSVVNANGTSNALSFTVTGTGVVTSITTPSITLLSPTSGGGTLTVGQSIPYSVRVTTDKSTGAFNLGLASIESGWPGQTGNYIPLVGSNGYSAVPSGGVYNGTATYTGSLPVGNYYLYATWNSSDGAEPLYAYYNNIAYTVSSSTVPTTATPAITSLTPASGATGSAVTITGTGFTSSNQVMFGGYVAAGSAVSANGTSLTFTVPAYESPTCTPGKPCSDLVMNVQPGVYQVSVVNANGTSNTMPFTVVGAQTPIAFPVSSGF